MGDLKTEIDRAKRRVRTDMLALSISEFSTMYENDEIEINPEFQRLFRWGVDKKSAFIESIFMGIPIPPIFIYENKDGTWELIDGLQRISTIFEFMGILRDPVEGDLEPPSVLRGTTYLPSLERAVWKKSMQINEVSIDEQRELEKALQLFLRRSRLDIQVLKQPSDAETKFDLFQRLNRGGEVANAQEVRTCLVVMISPEFNRLIRHLAEWPIFLSLCRVSPRGVEQQRHVELATRFIVHTYIEFPHRAEIEEFLDNGIREVIRKVPMSEVEAKFEETFGLIHEARGDDALVPTPDTGERRAFTLRAIESIAVGVGKNLDKIKAQQHPADFVGKKIDKFWKAPEAGLTTASGMRASQRLENTLEFGEKYFDPDGS